MATLKAIDATLAQLNDVILGKSHEVKLALTCLLARGHLLIEDIPGMGKTTLSHALANCLGLSYRRIQFTSDLLPGDLLGVNIFNRDEASFEFHPGPVFANVVLADEINRAPPKTQSALLEAMEERQVTVEGETRPLPRPFFVIATQNPQEQAGTYALPESQLDRFMMRISLGYPSADAEKQLLQGHDRRHIISQIEAHLSPQVLTQVQSLVSEVAASDSLINYIYRLIDASRKDPARQHGLSPRAGMALLQAAKSWALIEGRKHLIPEDVQAVFPHIAEHRLSDGFHHPSNPLSEKILNTVDIF
ncbi:MAG: AAA family ATPase [Oleiphilaceae bacterium]|nr:AAA family ATPase [Oleiphilaceae bacterium]